jgi:hypothetical protein
MVVIGFYGFYVYQQNGDVPRIGPNPEVVNQGGVGPREFFEYMDAQFYQCTPIEISKDMGYWDEFKTCYQSKNNQPKAVAIVGDSHAEHLFIGLAEELSDINVVEYSKAGLPFLSNPKFDDFFQCLLKDQSIKVVLISAKWGERASKIIERAKTD